MADKKIAQRDKQYVWHPFTQMADWAKDVPSGMLSIESAQGVYLRGNDGKKYIDGVSSMWANLLGHNNSSLNRALKKQLSKVAHTTFLGLTHEPGVALAEKLVKIVPKGLSRVFYSDNGSTAVEVALKMAFQFWRHKGEQKDLFLSFDNAYHGDTVGAVSVGGVDLFHKVYRPLLFKTIKAMSPYCYRCRHVRNKGQGSRVKRKPRTIHHSLFTIHCVLMGCSGQCVRHFEELAAKHQKNIAAVIIEPMIQAAGGMITMPPGYMGEIDRIRKKYGLLLICDEVATGFGRTGRLFASSREGVKPDLMCLSKGITGGYLPLAATMATENIYRAFLGKYEEFKTFFHGHTYTANPLACALAIEVLAILEREKTIEAIQPKIKILKRELLKLYELENVGDVRSIGLMAGIEIVRSKTPVRDFETKLKIGQMICAECRKHGLIVRPLGNTIVLMPPLTITGPQIKTMFNAVRKSITAVTGGV